MTLEEALHVIARLPIDGWNDELWDEFETAQEVIQAALAAPAVGVEG